VVRRPQDSRSEVPDGRGTSTIVAGVSGMRAKDALGHYGEELAVRTLRAAGLDIIDRNWRCSQGEIDIVARDGATLVFCEVKTRTSCDFGSPAAAVEARKLSRLHRLAAAWLSAHEEHAADVRIDVVAVICRKGAPVIEHLRAVG
jgi:putative endonuclease